MRLFFSLVMLAASTQAATISTNLTITKATVSIGASGLTLAGPATLSGIGSGTFSATGSLSGLTGANANAPYTITLTTGDTITGTLTVPVTLLEGGQTTGTGSATVTGGTGVYVNAAGSFPSLAGSATGSLGTDLAVSFSGAGTIITGGPGVPTITLVGNVAGYSSKLAQDVFFIVQGKNICPPGYVATNYPLGTSLDNISIMFTSLGSNPSTALAYMIYHYNQNGTEQLGGLVPSTLAPGNYAVTVKNGSSTSGTFAVTVVARHAEFFTQNSQGSGRVSAYNYVSATQSDVNRFTTGSVSGVTISPLHPGQPAVVFFAGGGAVPGGDTVAAPLYDYLKNGVSVLLNIGGTTITPDYAGSLPGLSGIGQINFTASRNVPTGCSVLFQVSTDGGQTWSDPKTFISIAPDATSTACVQPGFTTSQLQNLDQGATYTAGGFSIVEFSETLPSVGTVKLDFASGAFTQYTADELAVTPVPVTNVTADGSCYVVRSAPASGQAVSVSGVSLDAGNVFLDGPAGSNITKLAFTQTNNTYYVGIGQEGSPVPLPGFGNGKLVAGTYALTIGGGKGVGAATATVTIGSPLTVTGGLPASITRGAAFTVNWTGGNATDLVEIVGSTSTTSGTGSNAVTTGVTFVCLTTAGAQTLTVPGSITGQMQAVSASAMASGTAFGSLIVASGTSNPFTAPLVAGGSVPSLFTAFVGTSQSEVYQ